MLKHRIKQFYINFIDKMQYTDIKFVRKHLNEYEFNRFNKLSISEQKHSVRVAYDISRYYNNKKKSSSERLIKLALLHDIGKSCGKLNLIDKSILVILDYISKGKIKRFSNIKKINIYYNHAEIGYNMLKDMGYDKKFLNIIRNHHTTDKVVDEELKILMLSDNKN